jgi:hypothetical protein
VKTTELKTRQSTTKGKTTHEGVVVIKNEVGEVEKWFTGIERETKNEALEDAKALLEH